MISSTSCVCYEDELVVMIHVADIDELLYYVMSCVLTPFNLERILGPTNVQIS